MICSVEGCERSVKSKGMCQTHYARAWRGSPLDAPIRVWKHNAPCEVAGCERPARTKQMCEAHYLRALQGRSLSEPIQRHAPGEWSDWSLNSSGYRYRYRRIDGRREEQLEHRFLMEQWLGRPLVGGENVHHVNGDRSDNRRENLELWNTSQPPGQRWQDKLEWAQEIVALYGPR